MSLSMSSRVVCRAGNNITSSETLYLAMNPIQITLNIKAILREREKNGGTKIRQNFHGCCEAKIAAFPL